MCKEAYIMYKISGRRCVVEATYEEKDLECALKDAEEYNCGRWGNCPGSAGKYIVCPRPKSLREHVLFVWGLRPLKEKHLKELLVKTIQFSPCGQNGQGARGIEEIILTPIYIETTPNKAWEVYEKSEDGTRLGRIKFVEYIFPINLFCKGKYWFIPAFDGFSITFGKTKEKAFEDFVKSYGKPGVTIGSENKWPN